MKVRNEERLRKVSKKIFCYDIIKEITNKRRESKEKDVREKSKLFNFT